MEESRLPGSAPERFAVDILSLFQSCVRRPESHDCAAAGEDSEVDERAEQSAGISACSFSSRRTGPRPSRAPGCRAQRAHDRFAPTYSARLPTGSPQGNAGQHRPCRQGAFLATLPAYHAATSATLCMLELRTLATLVVRDKRRSVCRSCSLLMMKCRCRSCLKRPDGGSASEERRLSFASRSAQSAQSTQQPPHASSPLRHASPWEGLYRHSQETCTAQCSMEACLSDTLASALSQLSLPPF